MTMPIEQHARLQLNAHLVDKATTARVRYGMHVDADAILAMLDDREVVRYPTGIVFDAGPLQPHEFAWAKPLGVQPSDGFLLFIHAHFEPLKEHWPALIAYHIPSINYGAIIGPEQAELFGAALLGLDPDHYYRALCDLIDGIGRPVSS